MKTKLACEQRCFYSRNRFRCHSLLSRIEQNQTKMMYTMEVETRDKEGSRNCRVQTCRFPVWLDAPGPGPGRLSAQPPVADYVISLTLTLGGPLRSTCLVKTDSAWHPKVMQSTFRWLCRHCRTGPSAAEKGGGGIEVESAADPGLDLSSLNSRCPRVQTRSHSQSLSLTHPKGNLMVANTTQTSS
jgi:hypothetical protein